MIKSIAYLGPAGTFTHEATQTLFPDHQQEFVPYTNIPDVFISVEQGITDLGVVPMENAIEGSVNSTIDWLIHQVDLPIVGELIYPIKQSLLVHPSQIDCPADEFQQILSHPQAIAQCQQHLREKYTRAEWVYTDSTGQAAEMLNQHPDQPWLAIGTERAAKKEQLHIRETNIQDHENNFTRFVAIGKPIHPLPLKKAVQQKTTLQITLSSDFAGALHQVLATFAWRKINLTHIESRPTKTGLGNYFFIIDAEGNYDHVLIKGAIAEIKALGCAVRVLGSYPSYQADACQTVHT